MALTQDRSLAESLAPVRQETSCKICGAAAPLHGVVDFSKSCEAINNVHLPLTGFPVWYHRCSACKFLFSEQFDHWDREMFRRHIYNDDYATVDPELHGARALRESEPLIAFVRQVRAASLLDYGGGEGWLARILNENGIHAESWDPVRGDDAMPPTGTFDLVTAHEVLEHTPTPAETCEQALSFLREGGLFLFSTVTGDHIADHACDNWYIAPRNGHISIHSNRSLELLFAGLGWRVHQYGPGHYMAFSAREGASPALINFVPRARRSTSPG